MKILRVLLLILLSGFFLFTSCDREQEKPAIEARCTTT